MAELTDQEKLFLEANKNQVNEIFAEKEKNFISQKAFEDGLKALEQNFKGTVDELKVIQDQIKENKEALVKQGVSLNTIMAQTNSADDGDIEKQLHSFKDQLRNVSTNKGSQLNMVLKTEYTRASVTTNPMGMMASDIGRTGNRRLALYDLFPKIPLEAESNGVYRYLDQSTATRNGAAIAESAAYPESAYAATGYSLPVEKIGDSIPITEESLRFTKQLAKEVELFMQTNVEVAIETNLATGNGTSPNLKGIYTSATTYTAPNLAITDANIFDLIVKVSEDITGNTTYGAKYMPDVALMNITDINRMRLKKDSTNNYIIPPFTDQNGRIVAGMRVVECPSIAANTMCIGDSRFARIIEEGGINMSFGWVSTNFTEDVVTMKARKHMALLVRTIDATGWRKVTDIDAALVLLA